MFLLFSLQSRDVRRFAVGQNIFETSSRAVGRLGLADTIREGILGLNGWYSEVTSFDPAEVDSYRRVHTVADKCSIDIHMSTIQKRKTY